MTIHRHFEDLIFSGTSISSAEKKYLIEHLKACPECETLFNSWQAVSKQIQSVQMVKPSPNFVEKWYMELDNRKLLARTMQARKMLLISSTGTVLALLIAFGLTMVLASPAGLIIGVINSINNFVMVINLLHMFSTTVFNVIPPIIPFYYTLVFSSTFCLLTVLWIYSIWRISLQGVRTK